jgi:hypothetical protein
LLLEAVLSTPFLNTSLASSPSIEDAASTHRGRGAKYCSCRSQPLRRPPSQRKHSARSGRHSAASTSICHSCDASLTSGVLREGNLRRPDVLH